MGYVSESSLETRETYSESEYFALETNRRMEFSNGSIEFLPIPTVRHHRTTVFLFNALEAFVTARNLGEVLFIGVRYETRIVRHPTEPYLVGSEGAPRAPTLD
jgi:Uma2 family endonuclease